jgi:pantetheine-phosphate adenylyltransferase
VTNGHLDIIERAYRLFGEVTILVAESAEKSALFTVKERIELVRSATNHLKKVTVESTGGLLAEFAREKGSKILIRGLRAISDFEYEFAMATMNRSLYPELETVFLMTSENLFYISSRMVKEVARHGGDCSRHVPTIVVEALKKKFK